MKKHILLSLFCLASLSLIAQSEASTWYFGYNSGIKFNQRTNTITTLTDGNINTFEGCATISDDLGDLLFYTDGSTIWNKTHAVMANGFGLYGDSSSTQSAIIVPKPGDENIYYVFTVDDHNNNEAHLGLNYSEVDITLNGGLGGVTSKNINLLPECSEKITAVLKDCVTKSIWVISFASAHGTLNEYDTFHAFEVTDLGVQTTSTKSRFTFPFGSVTDYRGYLKLAPDGTKMASANVTNGMFLYDFDTDTGLVSNQQSLIITGEASFAYGVEFSPDSQLLYVNASNDFSDRVNPINNEDPANHKSQLIQYNLGAANISTSAVVIDNRSLYRGGLQLAPNGKIYRALSATYTQGLPYLGAINNPNDIGTASNYQHNAVSLAPNASSQGLPPFIQSFFNTTIDIINDTKSTTNLDLCDNDTYTLTAENIPNATYTWTLDGLPLAEKSHELFITKGGHYEVYITPNNGDCALEGEAYVNYNTNPEAFDYVLLQCDEDGITDGITSFNLDEAHKALTGNVTELETKFFVDSARTSEISTSTYTNIKNPQTVYVEVYNPNTTCSDFSELTLAVSSTSSKDAALMLCDDDGTEDGFQSFNLNDADTQITVGLSLSLSISYYENYNDALLEENNLNTIYTNTTPYKQTLYARVENANNCYGISEVILTVNKLPEIETEALNYYCINKFPETINLNPGLLNGVPNDYTYSWSTGENTYAIEVNSIGDFDVTVTNANGCSKMRTITIEGSNIATIDNIEVKDVSENNSITVVASGEGVYEYRLINSDNVVVTDYQSEPIFNDVFPGVYTVSVKDTKLDCGVSNQKVYVIGFPKFFTPNNDGYHDTWQVYGISSNNQPNSKIHIYDRYGKLVKQLRANENGWNGLFNGVKLPADDYWFVIYLEDGRVYKNHFTLKY
ncbi:T9SS type B sorting domain-containing protein [Algibacter miyuki]|uniref:T9SS type B sorting domain-containing protein n=1 Tax=Algibacter miyuki TaxID=1306933 RepID=A0ABV5H3I0_9FLAO|nr:T9SS type B sorting domain-containing protein [Algibacter miyuki]MDN3665523.1 T9SS type B sorting domain-containing protein [Algibacter miyuki]